MSRAARHCQIDIVSDVVCPWCVIGYKYLQQAMADCGPEFSFDVRWQPFELNPGLLAAGQDLREHVAQKYGASADASRQLREHLTALGHDLGFRFDYFDGMRIYNTFDAHRLLHWAADSGRQTALKLALFEAFFSQRRNIADHGVLVDCATNAGLDRDGAQQALVDRELEAALRHAQSDWLDRYISGVPTFVFNGETTLTGAQPAAILAAAIRNSSPTPA